MPKNEFLKGGGETGMLTRNLIWQQNVLGVPDTWPSSLQTTVANLLHCNFPMLLMWGPDLICFYNDAFRPSLGMEGKHPAIGKKCQEIWAEAWDFIGPLMEQVVSTGKPVWFENQSVPFYRDGKIEDIYWTFSYSPAYGNDGFAAGVLVVCYETTATVKALAELKEQKTQLNFAIDAAELGTWELNPATNTFRGNDRLKEWFGLQPADEIDLSLATNVIAENDRPEVLEAIAQALSFASGGHYDIEYTIIHPHTGKKTIVKAKGKAYFDEEKRPYTFNGTLQEVTSEAMTRKRLQESEQFSREVFYKSPIAKLVFIGEDIIVQMVNENMLTMLGRDQTIVGTPFFEVMPELLNTPLRDRIRNVMKTGETFHAPEEKLILLHDGKPYTGYYNYTYKALFSSTGEPYGIIVTATEVTQQVIARQLVEAKEKEWRDLITASPIGICVVKGEPLFAEEVNDRFLLIAGKSREQFERLPYWEVMYDIKPMFESTLETVFKTGIKFSSEEHEMTLVRAGIPEKIFATFEYIPILNTENVVSKVIILAIEVTYQVESRRQIEEAVISRTKELAATNLSLKRSNAELEQFAYIASHDLQEPIRKIAIYTQMLEDEIVNISVPAQGYIEKIYGSTDRMIKLVRDVLAFSRIESDASHFQNVDLHQILEAVKSDFELQIKETGAMINISGLPIIEAIPTQMTQLFSNLLSNSLKYRRPETETIITISASIAKDEKVAKRMILDRSKKYYHIEFSDNGIGFDQAHAERIFRIFQRLHAREQYEGTGIGLAICMKIVHAHQGHISAIPGDHGGATFNILLPVVQDKNHKPASTK